MTKPKIGFICVHNSCRSQMAQALGQHLAADVFESHSAGTELRAQINPDACRLMREIYGLDMAQTQRSKLLSDLPALDIVITMGCNVSCPTLPCRHREDWGLDDPSGTSDAVFRDTIAQIHALVLDLRARISRGELPNQSLAPLAFSLLLG